LKQLVKKISCVYENRSSVRIFRQILNVRAHLASSTSLLILHHVTAYIRGVWNEEFISKNLFIIQTFGLHHYKGKLSNYFFQFHIP